jgi:hypothetical protein
MNAVRFKVVLEDGHLIRAPEGVSLPQGEVEVAVRPIVEQTTEGDPLAPTREWLLNLATEAERTAPSLPSDMAENHDHYAHGKPCP